MKYIPVAVRSQDRMETFPGFNIIVTFLALFHGLHSLQDSILLCIRSLKCRSYVPIFPRLVRQHFRQRHLKC